MELKTEDRKSSIGKIKNNVIMAILVIIGLYGGYILGVIVTVEFIVPYISKVKYEKAMEEYLKPYKEDYVGGNTPEETIDLFIEALKKEDYELAVKYFEIQEQPRWRESFKNPNRENIEEWISEIENNKKTWHKEQKDENTFEFWYNIGEGENERTSSIYVRKNINKWKIEGF